MIFIIMAAFLTQNFVYAPTKLTLAAVDCINNLAAYFKVPTPYISPDEDGYVEQVESFQIAIPYLNRDEANYEGETNLTKLMLVKSAIANLRNDFTERDTMTHYYTNLRLTLTPTNIKTPSEFCEKNNSFIENILDYIPFLRSTCMKELEGFPQGSAVDALNHAYENVVLSDFAQSKYGTAYMKHMIKDVMDNDNIAQPEKYCQRITRLNNEN